MQVPAGPMIRAYEPDAHAEPLPLVLFIHGGGWFAGNLDTEDRTCRMICNMLPASVISVGYRCDIDVPLEHEIEDCYTAFEWARSHAPDYGADPDRIVVVGGSAGAALAAAVVHRLVQSGKGGEVAGLCSMNGLHLHPDAVPREYKHRSTSYVDNAGFLPFVSGHDTLQLYAERGIDTSQLDITIFPAAGGPDAVRGFPPTYIITSDNDASRDDGTVFEAVLRDAGVIVKRDNVKGLAHYFWVFNLPKANADFWSSICRGISWTLGQ